MRPTQFDDRTFGDDLFERMNRQFEGMRRQWDRREFGGTDVPLDVAERDGELVVTADVPGFERSDVDVAVSGDLLTITAERRAEDERADDEYIRRERRHARVRRTVRLPVEIDESAASATYANGVLTIRLPERESGEDDAHHIDVE